jgi:hypothetical protein
MIESSSDYSRVLIPVLNKYGYSPKNLTLLGTGSEGAVYSTTTHIFKFFFKGNNTISKEKLEFISKKFRHNKKISGVRQLSAIINDRDMLVFVTPYEVYTPYQGGDSEQVLAILVDAKCNEYIYTNFHPKNLMYDSRHKLRIIDLGRSLESYNENGYDNMIRRAYLSTYFSQKSDLVKLMSSLHHSVDLKELHGIDAFLKRLSVKINEN